MVVPAQRDDDLPGGLALRDAIDAARQPRPWRRTIATVGRLTGRPTPCRLDDAATVALEPLNPTPPSACAADLMAVIARVQAGDKAAFGVLYDRYVGTVFRFVLFRVGDRHTAEDLTADTFVRALRRIGTFTWQGRDPGAWLVTIARNVIANHRRAARRRCETTTDEDLDAFPPAYSRQGNPEHDVIDHLTSVELLTAVKQLKIDWQEVIVLRFLQGLSVAETAAALDTTEGAVKMRQRRALQQLGQMLPEGPP